MKTTVYSLIYSIRSATNDSSFQDACDFRLFNSLGNESYSSTFHQNNIKRMLSNIYNSKVLSDHLRIFDFIPSSIVLNFQIAKVK